jgi:hypothetical protein
MAKRERDVNATHDNASGCSALMRAASVYHDDAFAVVNMFCVGKMWMSLHYAAKHGTPAVVARLIAAGAMANAPTMKGLSALHLCCDRAPKDALPIARLLHATGKMNLEAAVYSSQNTPLLLTAWTGTPEMLAAANPYHAKEMITMLLDTDIDRTAVNANGHSAFHLAANGHVLSVLGHAFPQGNQLFD